MSTQADFAEALLNPDLTCPGGLHSWNGSNPATRFAVYRNNVMVSLVDALADTYPVVQALVGKEFFSAMARVYAQARPPRSPVLAYYGQDFAAFIHSFAPAASVPYLADVARLEMARVLAYHAADVTSIAPQTLQEVLTDPQQLASARLILHPSAQIIASPFAVLSIWAAHQDKDNPSAFDPTPAQTVLVFRLGLAVDMLELLKGTAHFVQTLHKGDSLLTAASQAAEYDAEFDLTQTLALLLRLQLVTDVTTEKA
ncbi:DNA-binding domain-containing protein [Rhodoferax fermentans]|uniref:DUF2063 domain-containing protein n=1 Tax=Rhodoferax fermentans TaxID=28066 RepID=A0A1T1AP24_RHOFE|nr:DNA-binding domain-containing protein [Rhodoferax fermentans]MBK1683374.1 DUF2063 domain-containing protein [Rhodoferax fermentans]OOV05876.1 DUF2063 domain-containing protein [Rhodoferax fermentans]